MTKDELMMQRCLQLAAMGAGRVAPNPMVGAVLVHENEIIGEGYHEQYGQAHAEVNCIHSVPQNKKSLIPFSTLYVSLEPCVHFGKTPPCTDRVIAEKIPRVVVGCVDPSLKVSGKGLAKMRQAGIEVTAGVNEESCIALNKRFFTFHQKLRPYIILKWAQSADGFIALPGPKPAKISNPFTDRLVHSWRSREDAILIGSNTAAIDDPHLTNRLWTGKSPVRVVLNRNLKLPSSLNVFNGQVQTLIYNQRRSQEAGNVEWVKVDAGKEFLRGVMDSLYEKANTSVLVEGGRITIDQFIHNDLWDEIRVITASHYLKQGLRAPLLEGFAPVFETDSAGDRITYFKHT